MREGETVVDRVVQEAGLVIIFAAKCRIEVLRSVDELDQILIPVSSDKWSC